MPTREFIPVPLHDKQLLTLLTDQFDEVLLEGEAGSGKSDAALAKMLYNVDIPTTRVVCIRKTSLDLKQPNGMMDKMKRWMSYYPEVSFREGHYFKFPSGAEIHFRHLDQSGSERHFTGGEYSLVVIDEADEQKPENVMEVTSRLRMPIDHPGNIQVCYVTNPSFTPMGLYLRKRFIESGNTKRKFRIQFKLEDNPSIDPVDYRRRLRSFVHDPVRLAQLLRGDWFAYPENGFFYTPNIQYIKRGDYDAVRRVRAYDLGTMAGKGDYSVGTLMSNFYIEEDGEKFDAYVIEDIIRGQWAPKEIFYHMQTTAALDSVNVPIVIESEIGAAGENLVESLREGTLRGYVVESAKIQDSKVTRAGGLANALYNKRLYLIEAPWNQDLITEMNAFPSKNAHDDIIDSAAHAEMYLAKPVPGIYLI